MPKRVQDELYAFPPGHLCCGYKVRISRYEYDDVGLSLEGDRSDIESNPHIDPFLAEGRGEVVIGQCTG